MNQQTTNEKVILSYKDLLDFEDQEISSLYPDLSSYESKEDLVFTKTDQEISLCPFIKKIDLNDQVEKSQFNDAKEKSAWIIGLDLKF